MNSLSPAALPGPLDRLLDRSIVPGYSRIGFNLRRHFWAPDDPSPMALAGRTAMVSGATSGLGLATARALSRLGAQVVLVVRDTERGHQAAAQVAEHATGAGPLVERCDVSDLADVRRFVNRMGRRLDGLDVLVHNAGVMPSRWTASAQGHELSVATHVLGPVLMTELLLPLLADREARVVLVSSGGMYAQRLDAQDPDYRAGDYRKAAAYARSKRMQVALGPALQQRWEGAGVAVHALHPGWADTPGVADSLPGFRRLTRPLLRDASQGADTAVWLAATSPAPPGGLFWHDRRRRPTHYRQSTHETAQDRTQLWRWVRHAVDLPEATTTPTTRQGESR